MHSAGAAPPRLLESIPPEDLAALERDLDRVQLPAGRLLSTAHDPPRRVYFPDTAVIALSLAMHDGRTAGVRIVGREGVVGLAAIGGPACPAGSEATVQVEGTAWTMTAERLRGAIRASDALRLSLERYGIMLLAHLAQTVVCNRLHSLDERAARWLLLIYDRVEGSSFPLTQEAFADLLGVSRPAVSTVGAQFARAGAAEFRRGIVHVHDPEALAKSSCECIRADRETWRPMSRWVHQPRPETVKPNGRGGLMMRPQIRRAR